MLAGRPHIEPRRRDQADSVVVTEIYLSLQGESSHAGKLCSFVRLTGCHLRCTWCDSAFAFHGGRRMKIPDVVAEVARLGSRTVEITGGEPLLQPGVYPLMDELLDRRFEVLLETSGAIDVRLVPPAVHKIVDLKAPSSGECERNDYRVLDSMNENDELKFVIGSREDYQWARAQVRERGLGEKPFGLLYSTVYGKLSPTQLAEWLIEDRLPGRLQLQLHKYLWDPDARAR
ncbi:MAG TPA: radical SAM protein [Myxococcaceae bacterium]|jgi:7-carboxy-7-deazaguanine synthase|nr:radical SAM protein [Myxococcaceae bacterium]